MSPPLYREQMPAEMAAMRPSVDARRQPSIEQWDFHVTVTIHR